MSLTVCLRKAGDALHAQDKAAIVARANELRQGGAKAGEAARQAVRERLDEVRGLLAAQEPASQAQDARNDRAPSATTGSDTRQGDAGKDTRSNRDHFTVQRGTADNTLETVTFERGEHIRYQIGEGGKWASGQIDGISHARREFSVDGLWHPFGFAHKAERPEPVTKGDAEPLSKAIERANKKHGADLTDDPSLPVNTGANARMVVIDKDAGNVALFSRSTEGDAPERRALQALADNDELFALPRLKGKTVSEIAFDLDPTIKVTRQTPGPGQTERWRVTFPEGGSADISIRAPNLYGPTLYGFDLDDDGKMVNPVLERPGENPQDVAADTDDVILDASRMKEGQRGDRAYAIAGALAHNTGRIFIGDPAGLSDVALRRRSENMLSLALRYGTSDFLGPHPSQVRGSKALGVPPLGWVYGDDVGNIERLIAVNVAAVDNAFPDAKKLSFDVSTGTFRNAESGSPVGREALGRRLNQLRSGGAGPATQAQAGGRTIARAAVWRALLRQEGGAGPGGRRRIGLLADLGADGAARGQLKALFSRAHSDTFQALHDYLFLYKKAKGKTLEAVAAEIDPGFTVAPVRRPTAEEAAHGITAAQDVMAPNGARATVHYYPNGRIGADMSGFASGHSRGSALGQMIGDLAFNTGRKFFGDPGRYSADGQARFPEMLLSSALKHGTTKHLEIDARDAERFGIQWSDNEAQNARQLIDLVAKNVAKAVPEISRLRYNFSNGQFQLHAASGRWEPATEDSYRVLRKGLPEAGNAQALSGRATLQRAAYLHSLLRQARQGVGDDVLAALSRLGRVGGSIDPALKGIFYSRDEAGSGSQPGLTADAVREHVESIRSRWANAPRVVVVESMADSAIPPAVRDEDQRQRSQGATGEPEGFYAEGKVFLLASQLHSAADVRRVLLHEALGHFGLRGLYREKLAPILDQLIRARRAEVLAKAKQYGLKSISHADLRIAAEEVLAEMAETHPELGFVRRAVAAIRSWLREHGFADAHTITDDEIIRNHILPAREFVRTGKRKAAGGIAFSRAQSFSREQAVAALPQAVRDDPLFRPEKAEMRDVHATNALWADLQKLGQDIGAKPYSLNADDLGNIIVSQPLDKAQRQAVVAFADARDLGIYVLKTAARDAADNIKTWREDGFEPATGLGLQAERGGAKAFNTGAAASRNPATFHYRPRGISEFMFSRSQPTPGMWGIDQRSIRNAVTDSLQGLGKVTWWDKTIGTQLHKAERFPQFRPVFEAVQDYHEDTSHLANEAADAAPSILPKLEKVSDLRKWGLSKDDEKAVAAPIFEGTLEWTRDERGRPVPMKGLEDAADKMDAQGKARALLRAGKIGSEELKRWQNLPIASYEGAINNRYQREFLTPGIVWKDAELRSQFGLNDKQIGHYQEFLASINTSLDQAVAADVLSYLGDFPAEFRRLAMSDRPALREKLDAWLQEQTADTEGAEKALWQQRQQDVFERYARIDQLKARGYAPLMRFGKYKVNVSDAAGKSLYFGLFESKAAANAMARELAQDPKFKDARVERGVISQEAYKLLANVPMESLEMFADAIGAKDSEVFQEYLRLTKSNRSALKRLIRRKGTAGFAEDVPRVLAAFLTSNARMASGAMNLKTAKDAAQNIRDGDVQDEAVKLIRAVTEPNDAAVVPKTLLYVNFIGGSAASALVNMTQPITMTLPHLSQWGGLAKATARLLDAAHIVALGKPGDKQLAQALAQAEADEALAQAEADGLVSPQEIHHLYATAMAKFGGNPVLKRAGFIWSAMFSLAEQWNRRVSFIAAYKTAQQEGIANPYAFAEDAVRQTQGIYNRGNAANWAHNPVGGTLLTFKQFSVNYLEWITRMYKSGPQGKRAAIYALALLAAAGGANGLPFADDLDDLIESIAQALGYDFNVKRAKHDFIAKTLGLGDMAADVATRGLTTLPGVPLDVSIRMGMGDLVPGTGLLLRSNKDTTRETMQFAGAAGSLAQQYLGATKTLLAGDVTHAVEQAMPKAMQNAISAVQMYATGHASDKAGKRTMDVDGTDAVMKFFGFQPSKLAEQARKMEPVYQSERLADNVEGDIVSAWAQAIVNGDQDGIREARTKLKDWNAHNPANRIQISIPQLRQRVRALRASREDRFLKTVPKERRAQAQEALH